MDYEKIFRPPTEDEIIRMFRDGKSKKKMYYIIWESGRLLVIAPNELRKTDDIVSEIEADVWFGFEQDMIRENIDKYKLSRKELHDVLEIYNDEYKEHWHEDGWRKTVLERINLMVQK